MGEKAEADNCRKVQAALERYGGSPAAVTTVMPTDHMQSTGAVREGIWKGPTAKSGDEPVDRIHGMNNDSMVLHSEHAIPPLYDFTISGSCILA
jgi:hypothetical protein